MNLDSTARFSNRVENYVRFRPAYPPAIVELMQTEMNLNEHSAVADIGSGTGIFTKMLLETNCTVFGVEPNAAMRTAGEEFLKDSPNFKSVDGTAENTNLPQESVTHVTSAQAFHWFDAAKAKQEFQRILKHNGFIVLVWNERRLDADAFSVDYEKLLQSFGTDLKQVAQRYVHDTDLPKFFDYDFQEKSFENSQTFDFEGLKGRLLSSSYVPLETDERFPRMTAALKRIFARHQVAGKVKIYYDTKIYYRKF